MGLETAVPGRLGTMKTVQDAWLWLGAFGLCPVVLVGCSLDVPDKGEPFVSESIVGAWEGAWHVDGLPQDGEAELDVLLEEGAVEFSLRMAGGVLSGEGEAPLEMLLFGVDDEELVVLEGTADKLGQVVLEVSSDGSILGEAIPDTIPAVEIAGYVNSDEVYLQFLILSLFTGHASLGRFEQ